MDDDEWEHEKQQEVGVVEGVENAEHLHPHICNLRSLSRVSGGGCFFSL